MSIPMPRLGTPEVSSSHQIQPRVGQFQPTSSSAAVPVQCSSSMQSILSSASDPVYLIQCCSSSLPHPVLQFQSTSSSAPFPCSLPSSAPVPVYLIQCSSSSLDYLIQCCGSILPHPVFQLQSTSSSLQFQSTSSTAPISVYLTPVLVLQSRRLLISL